jgi:hypothetical protein
MKRKDEREFEKLFQNTWVNKFLWVELVLGENDKLHHVRCKFCIVIKH